VRRSAIIEDGYAALRNTGEGIKGGLQARLLQRVASWGCRDDDPMHMRPTRRACAMQVSFVSGMGTLEAGLDYGGLVKEFLEEVCSS
jgi:hypothetical protein